METLQRTYKVDKTQIGFIKFIFEAHEGIATPTTLDGREGIIRLAISPGQEEDARCIIEELGKDFEFYAI